jgi:CrcB protein
MNGEQLFFVLVVALGGALGTVLRYGLTLLFSNAKGISWEIVLINLIGSFLICFVFFKFADISQAARLFMFVGMFGGFTTMSAVSLNFMDLFSQGQAGFAFIAILANAVVCVGGGFMGRIAASLF